jgi:hypothetical protein
MPRACKSLDSSIPDTNFTQGWKIGNLAFIDGQISADDKAKGR